MIHWEGKREPQKDIFSEKSSDQRLLIVHLLFRRRLCCNPPYLSSSRPNSFNIIECCWNLRFHFFSISNKTINLFLIPVFPFHSHDASLQLMFENLKSQHQPM